MKILFVCKHNRFRSQLAEAFFKKFNKNNKIKVKSAGIFKGVMPLEKSVREIAKKDKIKLTKTKGLEERDLIFYDLIVIVADNVPKSLFKRAKKVIVWKIRDTGSEEKKKIEKTAKKIKGKILNLVNKLEK